VTASSRTTRLAFVAIVVVPLAFVLLFGWPGFLAQPTYYEKIVALSVPDCGNATSPVWIVSLHGTTFKLWYSDWCSGQGGGVALNGTGSESNHVTYPFGLYDSNAAPRFNPWMSWTAPDGRFGVAWNGGDLVNLTVEA